MPDFLVTVNNGLSATINRNPEGDVLPGEPVMFWVSGLTGFNGTDEWDESDFVWDFDDSGATYSVGGTGYDTDASTEKGRHVSKAWESTGSKTVTLYIRVHGQDVPAEVTTTVNVVSSDTITWDKDLYVDFGEVSGTPNFTGAPAEAGAVVHIDNLADLLANDPSLATDKTRITFKAGETFTWGATSFAIPGRVYVRTLAGFGSGDTFEILPGSVEPTSVDDEIKVFSWGNGQSIFANSRFACVGAKLSGTFNPVTGACPDGLYALVGGFASGDVASTQYIGTHKCEVIGAGLIAGSAINWRDDVEVYLVGTDCSVRNWHNFGISMFVAPTSYAFTGCMIKQHPLALVSTDARGVFPGAADHGPGRIGAAVRGGIVNSGLASNSGWSSLGTYEKAVQACWRHNFGFGSVDYIAESEFSWVNNKSFGSIMVTLVHDNPAYLSACRAMFDQFEHNFGRQALGGLVGAAGGGIYVKNAVQYYANVSHDLTQQLGIVTLGSYAEGATTVNPAYYSNPIRVRFNTLVSDRSSASGGNESIDVIRNRTFVEGLGLGFDIVEENNIIEVPNHANAGSYTDYTPLDRANSFRPVTGSAAIDAVSSGAIPVRDNTGNLRLATTNIGAHDVESGSGGTVSAPSNSVAPVIAELSLFPGELAVTSEGAWLNVDGDDLYFLEWSWEKDGAAIATPKRVVCDTGPTGAGDYPVNLTATNRSAARVTAQSNAVTIV